METNFENNIPDNQVPVDLESVDQNEVLDAKNSSGIDVIAINEENEDLACKHSNELENVAIDEENEYQMKIEFTSLKLNDKSIRKIQIILLCGDIMSKFDMCKNEPVNEKNGSLADVGQVEEANIDDNFCDEQKIFLVHSTPTNLAKKLAELSILFTILTENDVAFGNPMMMELDECFTNSVKCKNFEKESLTKKFKIAACEECSLGEISIDFTITKDSVNSERFRSFYVRSTAESKKINE
ncbi:hypothetical protein PVAND_004489 [Polypedilum vanderplanki]|uniref:Uncharacterized protein n=1 Tax=Polypedilum vanderplanki TaxID=319348 RepID=A0A9J6BXC7_POLVA|nr:hypothetical protein PVAND_004489 [Polypedilum vanderplanki]